MEGSTSDAKLMATATASSPAVREDVKEALSPRILLTGAKRLVNLAGTVFHAAALQGSGQ